MKSGQSPESIYSIFDGRDDSAPQAPLADPDLVAQGWERRHMVDSERAAESEAMYRQLGFEVKLQELKPSDFGDKCQACASGICKTYVVVYTRK